MLQTEQSGLDIIAPLAGGRLQKGANPVAVDEVEPVGKSESAEQLRDAEPLGGKLSGISADGVDLIIVAKGSDGDGFAVEGEKVVVPAAMIHVSAHEIDATGGADDNNLVIEAKSFPVTLKDLGQFLSFFGVQVGMVAVD